MTPQRIHPVDEVLPLRQLFTFGLQHVLVMYAGAVAVPLILGSAMGLTSAQVVLLNSCFVGDKADELLSNLQLELAGLDIALTVI